MRALLYLYGLRLKNQFKTFLRSPGKLILTAIFVGLFVLVLWSGGHATPDMSRDPRELSAIVFALYAWLFLLTVSGGLEKGTTFFRMSDVNLLFPAPVAPTKVLMYGLGQQLSTSLMVGFFIVYQYSWLHGVYGVNVGGLLILLLGYALTLFFAQLTAMAAYSLTSVDAPGQEGRKRHRARIALYAGVGLFLIQPIAMLLSREGPFLDALAGAALSPSLQWFPVAGWLRMFVTGLLAGRMEAFGWLALTVAFGGVMLWLLVSGRADFYEDVLQASERADIARVRAKEGKTYNDGKVKVGATGMEAGMGASTLYFKQRLESRRERILLMDKNSWIFLLVSLGFGFIMREEGLLPAFLFATYMQVFGTMTGRWVRELLLPYIYLIPETPFRKLWYCLRQGFEKLLLESALLWIPLGLLLRLSPVAIALCVLARFSFGLLFTVANLLVERLWGSVLIKWLILTLYFLCVMVLLAPGVATGIVLTSMGWIFLSVEGTFLLSMIVWNLALGMLVLYACRNVLERAELNQLQGV